MDIANKKKKLNLLLIINNMPTLITRYITHLREQITKHDIVSLQTVDLKFYVRRRRAFTAVFSQKKSFLISTYIISVLWHLQLESISISFVQKKQTHLQRKFWSCVG